MKAKKVSRRSRWKVFVWYQRCDEALTWIRGLNRPETIECLYFWLGNPNWWMKLSRHWLYLAFVLFFFYEFFYVRCWRLLISLVLRVSHCVTCLLCMALESVFTSSKSWENGDWHHPKYQMMWTGNHAVDDPEERDHMFTCWMFSSGEKERSWVWI